MMRGGRCVSQIAAPGEPYAAGIGERSLFAGTALQKASRGAVFLNGTRRVASRMPQA